MRTWTAKVTIDWHQALEVIRCMVHTGHASEFCEYDAEFLERAASGIRTMLADAKKVSA